MDLIMPWRDTGCPHRRAHFWYLRWLYGQAGFHVVTGDCPGEFNRAAARNAGVKAATSRVVAVVDADNLIPPNQIWDAGIQAQVQGWAKPFSLFGYLDEAATEAVYAGDTARPLTWEQEGGPQPGFAGGAYVMTKQSWELVGGMDEEFTGWGAEDDAFTITATRALGQPHIAEGTALHLWHPPPVRVTSAANYDRLMGVYVDGAGR